MPGLFDNSNDGSGISGILGGLGATLFPGVRQYQIQQQNAAAAQQALGPNSQPGMGQLITTNPTGAGVALGQRNLEATIDALTPVFGRAGAIYFSVHPEELSKYAAPQKVGPAEHLESPLNLLGMFGGAPNASQQQPPSSQPGPSNASVGGGGYQGPQNTAGQIGPEALQTLVERRLRGDTEVNTELSGGMSGLNVINKANFQQLLSKTMAERGITGSDLARIDARFPAYKDAVKKNADIGASMQLAQSEASTLLPLLKQAAAATNPSDFPIWNQARLAFMAQTGDPRTAALASYMNALVNTYSRGITTRSQGATDKDKEHIRDIVNPYWSKGQWDAGAQAITNEFGAAHAALGKNQNRIDVQFGFGKDAAPADIAAAQAALAKGANKNDIVRRFEEEGFNAPKF